MKKKMICYACKKPIRFWQAVYHVINPAYHCDRKHDISLIHKKCACIKIIGIHGAII